VKAANGAAWSQSFTVSDPTTIGTGETLELTSAYSGQLSFAADTGTLKLDDSANGFVLKHHSRLDRFDSRK
jgi:hypothetical protein